KYKDALRKKWRDSPKDCVGRAGWSLEAEAAREKRLEDVDAVIKVIERELKGASLRTQETMNYCLVEVAVHYPEERQRCIDLANRLEVLKDYPVPKGCTSPFAPIWIQYQLDHQ